VKLTTSAEGKNAWSYISTPYTLVNQKDNLTFTFTVKPVITTWRLLLSGLMVIISDPVKPRQLLEQRFVAAY